MSKSPAPTASIIVSSCERRGHLERCLLSLANQKLRENNAFEVIVADDGSRDGTHEMVRALAGRVSYQLSLVTQENEGFRKSRIVNKAISLARGSYVLLTDGDCIFPADHVEKQLKYRQRNTAWVSDCIRLDEELSGKITRWSIADGTWIQSVPKQLPSSQGTRYLKDRLYQFISHREKPKLVGNNVGVWLADLEKINGLDESFVGWGCEDDDLGLRLRAAGVKVKTNMWQTFGYHLWHPVDATTPATWREGDNISYYQREIVLTRCLNGFVRTQLSDLNFRVTSAAKHEALSSLLQQSFTRKSPTDIDIEITLGDCETKANRDAEKRVQVNFPDESNAEQAYPPHLVLTLPKFQDTIATWGHSKPALATERTSALRESQCFWLVNKMKEAILGIGFVEQQASQRSSGGFKSRVA